MNCNSMYCNTIPMEHNAMQYNTIQIRYNPRSIQYATIHCNTAQYTRTIRHNKIHYNLIQYNAIQYRTIYYATIQSRHNQIYTYNVIQSNTIQILNNLNYTSTLQWKYNTMHYNAMTWLFSETQCNTVQCNTKQNHQTQYNTIQTKQITQSNTILIQIKSNAIHCKTIQYNATQ